LIEYKKFEPYVGEPDKERLRAAIKMEPVDRVPNLDNLIEDRHVEKILGRYAGNTLAYEGDPAKGAGHEAVRPMYPDDFIDLCNVIGQDIIIFDAGIWTPFKKNGEDGNLIQVSDKSIKNRKDFELLTFDSKTQIDNAIKYTREYKNAVEAKKSKVGVVGCYGCILQTLYEFVVGMNDFMMMCYEDEELVDDMLEVSTEHFVKITKTLVKEKVDFIFLADDVAFKTGLFLPPKIMKKIWVPRMARIAEPAVNASIPIIFHSDGKIDDIVEDLIEMGVDCINPLDPYGIDYRDYKKRFGSRVALCGNIDIEFPLSKGTPEDVERDVAEHMNILKPGYGYVSDSSHSIVNYIPHENYIAYINSVHKYGVY
jgi:uroporphyrinogen decarboxylase